MFRRMNIRRTKGVIWLMNIAAILCISLVFVTIYEKKNDGKFKPVSGDTLRKALEMGINNPDAELGGQMIDINNYKAIWKANISGEKVLPVDPNLASEAVEAPKADTIKDVVSVMWICDSPDPEERWVRLAYLKEKEQVEPRFILEILNREGDSLRPPYEDAKVVKIEADKVTFSYKGREEILRPLFAGEEEGERAGGPRDPRFPSGVVRSKTKYTPPEESKEVEPGNWHISRDERKYVSNNWQVEWDNVTVASIKNPKTGKTELELTELKPGSLAAKRGFQKNDKLISINGIPINTKSGAINYVKENPDLPQYVVVISRNGQLVTKTFTVPSE